MCSELPVFFSGHANAESFSSLVPSATVLPSPAAVLLWRGAKRDIHPIRFSRRRHCLFFYDSVLYAGEMSRAVGAGCCFGVA
jgi:hypothetical protein